MRSVNNRFVIMWGCFIKVKCHKRLHSVLKLNFQRPAYASSCKDFRTARHVIWKPLSARAHVMSCTLRLACIAQWNRTNLDFYFSPLVPGTRFNNILNRPVPQLSVFWVDLQGEHKVFPWLQTFITRILRGIQRYFLIVLITNLMHNSFIL
jgi:hypothetical protein